MNEFRAALLAVFLLLSLTLAGCETVQTTQPGTVGVDRKQSMILSSAEVDNAAVQAYTQTMQGAAKKGALNRDPAQVNRVRAIASRLIPATGAFRADAPGWKWEVNVVTVARRSTPGACPAARSRCTPGSHREAASSPTTEAGGRDGTRDRAMRCASTAASARRRQMAQQADRAGRARRGAAGHSADGGVEPRAASWRDVDGRPAVLARVRSARPTASASSSPRAPATTRAPR